LRNKVRDAQVQELKKMQEECQRELGEWKRRNHCQIQAKIDECLSNFGEAHIAAVDASCEENEYIRQTREDKGLMAAVRGRKAMLQVQREREKQAEERLMKKKRNHQKTIGTQADFLAQQGLSETLAAHRRKNILELSDDDEDEEQTETVFTSQPNVHKHSINIDTNYNAQNFTSHSVDSSNNCDSDEVQDLQDYSDSEVEFNQIKNILMHADEADDDIIFISESVSSDDIIHAKKAERQPLKNSSPKKKSILIKTPKKIISSNATRKAKSPNKKTSKHKPVEESRVRYVDYTKGRYETTYVPPNGLITRSERSQFNAKQEAQVQTQPDDEMISKKMNADTLK
jgi:hypothetical protein